MQAIQIQNLSKNYQPAPFGGGPGIIALHNVSLDVEQGTIYTLLGPNGAGKTTLIRILGGLMPPAAGTVLIDGIPIGRRTEILKKIGLMITGEKSYFGYLTAWENMLLFASLQGLRPAAARQKIKELAGFFGVEKFMSRKMGTLSSGTKQRLLLARTLLHDPEIILLDEPINHLDPMAAREFHALLRNEISGKLKRTVFLATHQLEEAQEISDVMGFLFRGRLIWQKPAGVFRSGQEDLLGEYIRTVETAV